VGVVARAGVVVCGVQYRTSVGIYSWYRRCRMALTGWSNKCKEEPTPLARIQETRGISSKFTSGLDCKEDFDILEDSKGVFVKSQFVAGKIELPPATHSLYELFFVISPDQESSQVTHARTH
jgi:hypothetical protein